MAKGKQGCDQTPLGSPGESAPAEIDQQLSEIWVSMARVEHSADYHRTLIEKSSVLEARKREAEIELSREEAEIERLRKLAEPLEHEYRRRGWSRAWLCVSSEHGHVHREGNCHTLVPGHSQVTLMPQLSGLTDEEIVGQVGYSACTHCYPDAPAHPAWQSGEQAAQAEQAARSAQYCPGSGTRVPYDEDLGRRSYRYVSCPSCGGTASLTPSWAIRKHRPNLGSSMERAAQHYMRALRQRFGKRHVGEAVEAAAVLLADRLAHPDRGRPIAAQVVHGTLRLDDQSQPHTWVQAEGWILDPARPVLGHGKQSLACFHTTAESEVYQTGGEAPYAPSSQQVVEALAADPRVAQLQEHFGRL